MLTVTLVSLVVAAASGFVAWRSVRREHLRTDARIAWLATAIDSSPGPENTALGDALDWFGQEAEPGAEAIFDEHEPHETRHRPLLTAVAGLAVVLAVVVLIAMTGTVTTPRLRQCQRAWSRSSCSRSTPHVKGPRSR